MRKPYLTLLFFPKKYVTFKKRNPLFLIKVNGKLLIPNSIGYRNTPYSGHKSQLNSITANISISVSGKITLQKKNKQ
jgi:hypothetical protein